MFALIKSESPDLLSAGGPDEFKKKQQKKNTMHCDNLTERGTMAHPSM